jgi:hypothetical protein
MLLKIVARGDDTVVPMSLDLRAFKWNETRSRRSICSRMRDVRWRETLDMRSIACFGIRILAFRIPVY